MDVIKTSEEYINESNNINCDEYFKDKDITSIPLDSCIGEDPQIYNGKYFTNFYYFGDCVNTVPKIWDATQMAGFCSKCNLYDINLVLNNIKDGDKKIPKTLINYLNSKDVNNIEDIVCAINEYQGIMFIYVSNLDKHFFFDCK